MVNIQDLRIGNYVKTKFGFQQIIELKRDEVWTNLPPCSWSLASFKGKDLEYIPLSEEWLLNLGFHKLGSRSFDLDISSDIILRVSNCATENEFIILVEGNGLRIANQNIIRLRSFENNGYTNVHEIQNIVHSISGYDLQLTK